MTEAVQILDACRTPIDKAGSVPVGGHPDGLSAQILTRFIQRSARLNPRQIGEVLRGSAISAHALLFDMKFRAPLQPTRVCFEDGAPRVRLS